MDYIREQLENVVTQLQKMRQNYITELEECPSGHLINNRSNEKPVFYHSKRLPDQKYKRKLLHLDNPMIKSLARKEYLEKIIPRIEKNIRWLGQALQKYSSLDPASIIDSMGRAYRFLESQNFFCDEVRDLWDVVPNLRELTDDAIKFRCDMHREWANADYEKNPYPFPEEKFLTASGMRVRSRGEIIICDRLDHFGIPNRFDQLIYLNDGSTAAPDFSFEDRNMDEFYLEYCGMMDDPGYVNHHLSKRNRYERSGIVPWKNIFYLYSVDSGISVPEIDSVIMNYIIPRL